MAAIKNYSSEIPINRIFERIQKTLVEHGATQIVLEYSRDQKVSGLTFVLPLHDKFLPIRLPARLDKAQALLKQQYETKLIRTRSVLDPEQAYRVAWRNILDWIEAQMALVDIEMVKIEEIFLPYITSRSGKTLFEYYEHNQFQLPSGEDTLD
jgi:hypothetical protein